MTHAFPRMTGTEFTADWFDGISVNTSAAERRASSLAGRRTVKKDWQAAWLARPDLATLAPASTYRGDFRTEWKRLGAMGKAVAE